MSGWTTQDGWVCRSGKKLSPEIIVGFLEDRDGEICRLKLLVRKAFNEGLVAGAKSPQFHRDMHWRDSAVRKEI